MLLFFKMIEVETNFPFVNSIAEFSRSQDPKATSELIDAAFDRRGNGADDAFFLNQASVQINRARSAVWLTPTPTQSG